MKTTAIEPMKSDMPAIIIIMYCGASVSGVPSIDRIQPPISAPIICGMHMEQLNKPRYAPMFPLLRELVSMVKGHASIAAHAHPISMNEMKSMYWSVNSPALMKPAAPRIRLSE